MSAKELPITFYQFTSDRFDIILLFLYKNSTIKASKLLGYSYIKALQEPITYFVASDIFPEFSIN